MKATKKIERLRNELIELFGPDDPSVKAVELKQAKMEIAGYFFSLRDEGVGYEQALRETQQHCFISESTVRRAIRFAKKGVQQNELNNLI